MKITARAPSPGILHYTVQIAMGDDFLSLDLEAHGLTLNEAVARMEELVQAVL
jgi:hypothetical protein